MGCLAVRMVYGGCVLVTDCLGNTGVHGAGSPLVDFEWNQRSIPSGIARLWAVVCYAGATSFVRILHLQLFMQADFPRTSYGLASPGIRESLLESSRIRPCRAEFGGRKFFERTEAKME